MRHFLNGQRPQWSASRRRSRGGEPKYPDLAITMCLTLHVVYDQPLRQTQGMMCGIAKLMGVESAEPDFSTLSRRGKGLALPSRRRGTMPLGPVHLVVDSTGLTVFGEGEWLEAKHGIKVKRKRWRRLHIGLDLVSGDITCSDLTMDDVGEPAALPGLLGQIEVPVERLIADGAYDASPSRDLLETRLGEIVDYSTAQDGRSKPASSAQSNGSRSPHRRNRDQGPNDLAEIHRL